MSDMVFVVLGIIAGVIVFWKVPTLPKERCKANSIQKRISVIIPARNEEQNLALLLKDLQSQSFTIYEVICVDDESEDRTAEIVKSFGAELISVREKPDGWTGKSWACQLGADRALGELLLFLDADVRLSRNGIASLIGAYSESGCGVSVQPYHTVEKWYEQISLFFNIVGIGANGICMIFKSKSVGLFGPVILLSREDYDLAGGHYSVRKSITDDLALGEVLTRKNIEYRLFTGGDSISLRMYGKGISQLVEGWSKNYITGAVKTSPFMLLMIIVWLGAYISVPAILISSVLKLDGEKLAIYSLFYAILTLQLLRISKRIGSFKKVTSVLYPLPLLSFLAIFMVSVVKRIFLGKTEWKGRKINLRR